MRFAATWACFSIAGWAILAAILGLRVSPAWGPAGALAAGSIIGLWTVGPIAYVVVRRLRLGAPG